MRQLGAIPTGERAGARPHLAPQQAGGGGLFNWCRCPVCLVRVSSLFSDQHPTGCAKRVRTLQVTRSQRNHAGAPGCKTSRCNRAHQLLSMMAQRCLREVGWSSSSTQQLRAHPAGKVRCQPQSAHHDQRGNLQPRMLSVTTGTAGRGRSILFDGWINSPSGESRHLNPTVKSIFWCDGYSSPRGKNPRQVLDTPQKPSLAMRSKA